MRGQVGVRDVVPDDHGAVDQVVRAAFGGEAEAVLVRALRARGDVLVELAALEDGEIVGHVLFSRLGVEGAALRAVALAPLAVRPAHQRRGHGTRLASAGLERCRTRGEDVAAVLGDPAFYGRLGFTPQAARGLGGPYRAAGDAFQALALRPGALDGVVATLRYPAPFADVG